MGKTREYWYLTTGLVSHIIAHCQASRCQLRWPKIVISLVGGLLLRCGRHCVKFGRRVLNQTDEPHSAIAVIFETDALACCNNLNSKETSETSWTVSLGLQDPLKWMTCGRRFVKTPPHCFSSYNTLYPSFTPFKEGLIICVSSFEHALHESSQKREKITETCIVVAIFVFRV